MSALYVAITSLVSLAVLFVLTKIMGNKQMSELTMFDYIIGISIGSIAAEMSTNLEDFYKPLIAMIIYALVSFGISVLTAKNISLRRIFFGKSLLLYQNGVIFRENFKKARLDMSEFLCSCRNNGYFDLSKLNSCFLEPNGRISFLPKSSSRPVTPEDLKVEPVADSLMTNLIIDGKVIHDNLKFIGCDEKWLEEQASAENLKISDVMLAISDFNNKVTFFGKVYGKAPRDMFQ